MSCLTAMLAIAITLFSFMGDLVDWLSTQSPDTLFASEGTKLLLMSLVVLVAMPVVVLLHALITYQSLLSNYPMRIRWQAHRYLLNKV